MSTTNRAFIKAYRQDTADPSPAGGSSPNARDPGGALRREAAVQTASAAGGQSHSSYLPQSGTQKLPLSSFISNTPSPQPSPGGRGSVGTTEGRGGELTDDKNFLEPGTTIAAFQWPKTCRRLGLQSSPQLDCVVDLLRAQADAGHSLVAIMGLFPRVGATTAALCLAARAARRVRRVMLVDGNFCHPRIAAWLDVAPTVGWEEVLQHAAPLADAVIRSTDDNLDVLALSTKAAKDPQALASGLQAAVTGGVIRHAYDLALFDIGTFFDPLSQPVVLELARNMGIDSIVAVSGSEPADPRDLATIGEYLEPSGCQLLGTIENRVTR
jgi:Mrp family chromosome partitioning ATPase